MLRQIRWPAELLIAASLNGCMSVPASVTQSAPPDDQRPNIVFLLADDHAAHAISAYQAHLRYGIKLPNTPNLDRLASDGMLFVNSFVTNSICGPARATVLTGQYGHINGVMTNTEPLHPAAVTFPSLLQDAGYKTALFGKWHLRTPPTGFDRYEILAGQGPYYNPVLHSATDSTRHTGYTLDIVTDRALEWMEGAAGDGKPFMMMLAFNGPHRWWDPGPDQLALYRDTLFAIPPTFTDKGAGRASPARDPEMQIALDLVARDLKLDPPNNLTPAQRAMWDSAYARENAALAKQGLTAEELARWKYQRYIADYMRVIAALDQQVGRVLDKLDESGLSKNTMLVYSSDQGFFLGDHGWFDKRWMYEESFRTPLLIKWPGVVRPGSVNKDLVMNLDLAETFIDIAGGSAPAVMQGESILPLLKGLKPAEWRDAIYYQYFEYPGWHAVRRQYGVRTDRYKLIHYYEVDEWELFDLEDDPEELRSVYSNPAFASTKKTLEAKLALLRKQFDVPAADPAPYYPWELPPEFRRPGTPGSTRNSEIGATHLMQHSTSDHIESLEDGIAVADSVVSAAIGTLAPGAVLSVAQKGRIVFEKAYGHAEFYDADRRGLESPRVMQANTIFDLASVTKVMATTFAVMKLVDQRTVDLDAPVHRYLTDFRGPHLDSITVRHLLNHSSGLAQWQPLYYQAATSAEAYAAIRAMPLLWGVGESRHYSDLGFMLLGYLVERVTGQTLDRFVDEHFYAPLGLGLKFKPQSGEFAATETGNGYERRMVYDSTFGYRYRGDPQSWNGWRQHVLVGEVNDGNAYYANAGVAGHAGLFGRARDLHPLIQMLMVGGTAGGRRYLSAETIKEFLTLDRYGHYLGWQLPEDAATGSFMHTGFTGTYALGIPAHDISVVLLTNRQHSGVNPRGFFPDVGHLRARVAGAITAGGGATARLTP